jgi:hypothetical protein
MLLFELMVEARLADLDREFDAMRNRTALLRELYKVSPNAEVATSQGSAPTFPYGEPGHGFVARRRAWLHDLQFSERAVRRSLR